MNFTKIEESKSLLAIPRPFLIALILVHFFLLYLTLTRTLDPFFNDAKHRLGPGTDFAAFYNAGKHWLAHQSAYGHGPGFGFRYHPLFAAILGSTLTWVKASSAYAVWIIIQELAFFSLLALFFRRLGPSRPFLLIAGLLTVFTPYYLEVYMGNSSFFATVLLFMALHFLTKNKTWVCTGFIFSSIIVKPIGLVFLPLLLLRKMYLHAAVILILFVGLAVPFFFSDPAGFQIFLNVNIHAIPAPGWVVHAGSQGFHGLATAFLTRISDVSTQKLSSFSQLPFFANTLLALLPILFVGLSLVANWRAKENLGIGIFLWSSTYLLGYKDVWEHNYTFALLALYWLYESKKVSWKILLPVAIIIAVPTAFVFYDVPLPPGPIDPEHHWSFMVSMIHHSTKSVPFFVLYGWVVVLINKNKNYDTKHNQNQHSELDIKPDSRPPAALQNIS